MNLRSLAACLVCLLFLRLPPVARAVELLQWDSSRGLATAQIDSAELQSVLRRIGSATGWQIYVEPELEYRVSVKFQDATPAEALKLILGDLNFALLAPRGGPSRLFVFRNSLDEAAPLLPAPVRAGEDLSEAAIVANELVVVMKPDQSTNIDALAARLGARVVGRIEAERAYRLSFVDEASTAAARRRLSADNSVADIESNYSIPLPAQPQSLQLSSPMPFQLKPKTGSDSVIVGLIDSSVQSLGQRMQDFLLPAIQVSGRAAGGNSELSHGTAMAETILRAAAQFAPSADSPIRILPVDVYGASPATTTFAVAQGIAAAVNAGATVINLSLAGPGESQLVANLVEQAHQAGVIFLGAAGNQPTTQPSYPAALPDVIAVTAGDRRGNIASYANRGNFVDVVAPGISLVQFQGTAYFVSGTSSSTAFVSGLAAQLRAEKKTATEVESELRASLAPKPVTAQ